MPDRIVCYVPHLKQASDQRRNLHACLLAQNIVQETHYLYFTYGRSNATFSIFLFCEVNSIQSIKRDFS